MARAPSKIMSIVEKKQAQNGLKAALKLHDADVKNVGTDLKLAEKALAAAKKAADATIKQLNKEQAVIAKAVEAGVKLAQKTFDAASTKATRLNAAAAKGHEKITGQLAALDAVVAVKAPKVAKQPEVVAA